MANEQDGHDPINIRDVDFVLSPTELFDYLKSFAPDGVKCPVCSVNHWGVSVTQGDRRGGVVLPDQVTDIANANPSGSISELISKIGSRTYSFQCINCAHSLPFSAMRVAAAVNLLRRATPPQP